MFDLDTFLLGIGKRIPLLNINSMEDGRPVLVHIFSGYAVILTGVLTAYLLRSWLSWEWLSWAKWVVAFLWLAVVVYQEAIPDGHWEAWRTDSWSDEMRRDFWSDIVTKLSGELALVWGIWFR